MPSPPFDPLILDARFPVIYSSHSARIEDFAVIHHRIEHPVIATFHPVLYGAFQICQGLDENGTAVGRFLDRHLCKPIFARYLRFEKISPQVSTFFQDVEDEVFARLRNRFCQTGLGDSHG